MDNVRLSLEAEVCFAKKGRKVLFERSLEVVSVFNKSRGIGLSM
jgi:hypothetical protein